MVEGWLRHPSEAWPYEALKRGLPRPFTKRRKKLGEGKIIKILLGSGLLDERGMDRESSYKNSTLKSLWVFSVTLTRSSIL
jgi:hypothetical protein